MPECWTGELLCKMHNNGITRSDLAKELGCSKAYISMLLNGTKATPGAAERLNAAADKLIAMSASC